MGQNRYTYRVLYTKDDYDVLITGDMEESTERYLMMSYRLPDIQVLIAGHHGAADSNSQAFLDEISPEKAVISVGYNSYGHPDEETVRRLEESCSQVYRTDTDGTIIIKSE